MDEAIKRFKYVKYHPYKFERITITIMICFMKMLVEVGTELISLAITATFTNSLDIIMNYIALSCISELDEVYYRSLSSPLKDQMEDIDFQLPIKNTAKIPLRKGLICFDRFLLSTLYIWQFLYECLYFHVFPFYIYVFIFIDSSHRSSRNQGIDISKQYE